MEDIWQHLVHTVVLVGGGIGWIVGLVSGWPTFIQNMSILPKSWRTHPQATSITFIVVAEVAAMVFIWMPANSSRAIHHETMKIVSSGTAVTEWPKRDPKTESSNPQKKVVNQQAERMAKEFEGLISDVSRKPLLEYERKFYADYLSATMPAKIATICGTDECAQYQQLLNDLTSKSDSIQLHFRGLEPFVTRKRFIQENTPPAGPVIELANNQIESPSLAAIKKTEPQPLKTIPATLPPETPVETKVFNIYVATEPDTKPPQKLDANNDHIDKPLLIPVSKIPPTPPREIQESSPSTPPTQQHSAPSQLDLYLRRVGWVQCRKCGQVHQMSFDYFALHDHHICARCGFTMSTLTFSTSVAKAKQRIIVEMGHNHRTK